jgi:hypothetical protein
METGGPPALIERFWRWVAGDSGWEHLEPNLRQRMLATADTFCDIERGTYETYRPDDDTLAAITTPVVVLARVHSPLFRLEIARWLAARLAESKSCRRPTPTPPTSTTSANWHKPCDPYYGSSPQPLEASEGNGP